MRSDSIYEQENPLISVCIPVFNGGNFLRHSIECVVNQDYQNLEIVVIDDGSNDDSCKIVEEYQKKDKRIKFVANSSNIGLVQNWNKCLAYANGHWIHFHFQDDTMRLDTISSLYQAAITSNVSVAFCDRHYSFSSETPAKRKKFLSELPTLAKILGRSGRVEIEESRKVFYKNFPGKNFLGEPILALVHQKVFRTFGEFDLAFNQIADLEYWMRITLNHPYYFLNEKLKTFQVHETSETSRNSKKEHVFVSDRLKLYEKLRTSAHYSMLDISLINRLIRSEISKFVKKLGFKKMNNLSQFTVYKWDVSLKARLIGTWKDLIR